MRMGFFMGAMVGAAAAYYFSKNKPNLSMADLSGKTMNAFMGMTSSGSSQKQNANKSEHQNNQGTNMSSNLGEVEKMINQDPSLKREVEEIMESSNNQSSYTQ